MRNHLLYLAASTLLAVGCTASGQMHSSASITAPELVYIGPDVQVIADYDEPVFYSSSYYWRYDGGVWYRSSNHRSGWVRIQVVPPAIQRIERPAAYVHFRGTARAEVYNTPAQRNQERREVQAEQQQERREVKAEQQQERREVKAEQKEERREQQEDRREQKAEQKAEKAEQKADRKDAKEDRKDAKEDRKQAKDDHGKKGR